MSVHSITGFLTQFLFLFLFHISIFSWCVCTSICTCTLFVLYILFPMRKPLHVYAFSLCFFFPPRVIIDWNYFCISCRAARWKIEDCPALYQIQELLGKLQTQAMRAYYLYTITMKGEALKEKLGLRLNWPLPVGWGSTAGSTGSNCPEPYV